jgi:hypothetical protein
VASNTIVTTATTHANPRVQRFHPRFLGWVLAASGVIASARILATFFLGNRAAIKTKAPASGRTPYAGATFVALELREAFGVRPFSGALARN